MGSKITSIEGRWVCVCVCVCLCVCSYVYVLSRTVVSDSWQPHGLQLTRLLCPRGFPRQSQGISQAKPQEGCHALLQVIFPTQGSNPGLPHCRQILYHLSHQGSPCTRTYIHIYITSNKLQLIKQNHKRIQSITKEVENRKILKNDRGINKTARC